MDVIAWLKRSMPQYLDRCYLHLLHFCKAAIRGDQRNPDNSKFIRGGADSASEAESAKGIIESRKGRRIESSLCDISAVFVIDLKLPEFNKG